MQNKNECPNRFWVCFGFFVVCCLFVFFLGGFWFCFVLFFLQFIYLLTKFVELVATEIRTQILTVKKKVSVSVYVC